VPHRPRCHVGVFITAVAKCVNADLALLDTIIWCPRVQLIPMRDDQTSTRFHASQELTTHPRSSTTTAENDRVFCKNINTKGFENFGVEPRQRFIVLKHVNKSTKQIVHRDPLVGTAHAVDLINSRVLRRELEPTFAIWCSNTISLPDATTLFIFFGFGFCAATNEIDDAAVCRQPHSLGRALRGRL
jgi:hypothetical protein